MSEGYGDLVLFWIEEQPALYARVLGFTPDAKYPGWFSVEFQALASYPPIYVKIGLNSKQVYEAEPFTINGVSYRIEYIPSTMYQTPTAEEKAKPIEVSVIEESAAEGKVLPFKRRVQQ